MKIHVTVEGNKRLDANIERTKRAIFQASKEEALKVAQKIMEESLKEVPRDTGALAEAAYVEQDSKGEVSFGYAGNRLNPKTGQSVDEYMVAVHERLDVHHPVGKAKFLEDPINRNKDQAVKTIGQRFREIFQRGGK